MCYSGGGTIIASKFPIAVFTFLDLFLLFAWGTLASSKPEVPSASLYSGKRSLGVPFFSGSGQWKQILQIGSNRGYFSYGFERQKSDTRAASISFGYSPSYDSPNGPGRGVLQLNLVNSFHLAGGQEDGRTELEVGLHVALNSSAFLRLPEHYPEGYYPQNMVLLSLGARRRIGAAYFLMGSVVDYHFEVLARNPVETFLYYRAMSIGFGSYL